MTNEQPLKRYYQNFKGSLENLLESFKILQRSKFLLTFLFYASFSIIDSEAQELNIPGKNVEIVNYKNSNSRNYAIASAKESKLAYQQCKAIYQGAYINRYYKLSSRAHVDTAFQHLLNSIQLNKQAYKFNRDTLNLGADYLYRSEQRLLQAQTYLYGILTAKRDRDIQYYGEVAMYYFGHAAVDAYNASMYLIDGTKTFEEIPTDRPLAQKDERYTTRLLFGEGTGMDNSSLQDNEPKLDINPRFDNNNHNPNSNLSQKNDFSSKNTNVATEDVKNQEVPESISVDQLEKLLNASEDNAKKFLESIDYEVNEKDKNHSRSISSLEADEAVFSELKYSYEKQIEKSKANIELLENKLKSAKSSREKRKISKELEKEKTKLAKLEEKYRNADQQLAEIQKDLKLKRGLYGKSRKFPSEKEVAAKIDYDLNPPLPQGLIYKVQIGYYPWRMLPYFKGKRIEKEDKVIAQLDGWNLRYLTGEYDQYNLAANRRDEIKNNFVGDAFIVAFYNGKKINMYEALSIENDN